MPTNNHPPKRPAQRTPAASKLNESARVVCDKIGPEPHEADLPGFMAGERIANEFLASLRDGQASNDELYAAAGLMSQNPNSVLRGFFRVLQGELE